MSEINYMIDIEALGTSRNCVIVSVGIVKFKIRTGEIFDEKYWELGLGEQQRKGRSIDSSTVMWWANQSPNTLKALSGKNRIPIADFIREFNHFIQDKGFYWAKGTNYDLEIITDLYRLYEQQPPFRYSKWSDARPYYNLAKQLRILPNIDREDAHNALEDAKFQTQVVCTVYKTISDAITYYRTIQK